MYILQGRGGGGGGGDGHVGHVGAGRRGWSGISLERMNEDLDDRSRGGRREEEWRVKGDRREGNYGQRGWRDPSPPSRWRSRGDDEEYTRGRGEEREEVEVNRLAERIERMEWRHKGEMQREKSTNEALASFASSLTRKMAELQTNLKLAEHKSSTLLSELEGQKCANSKLNQEAHELREILEKKNNYIDKLDREIEDTRGEARRLAEVVNTLQAENTTLKKKIGSSLRDYKTRTEELVKANLELESMTEACECSWTEVKVLRKKLENLVVMSMEGAVKDLSSLSDVQLCEMIMVEMRSSQDRERQLEGLLEHSRTFKDVLQHELYMAKESLAEFQGELRVQSEIGQEKLENEVRTQSLIRDLSSKLKEAREELLKERSEKEDVLRKHHVRPRRLPRFLGWPNLFSFCRCF